MNTWVSLCLASGMLAAACDGVALNAAFAGAAEPAGHFPYRTVETMAAIPLRAPAPHTINVLVVSPVGHGHFPLVLFNHGYGADAQEYAGFLEKVAREGYVVAGPNYTTSDVAEQTIEARGVLDGLTSPASPQRDRTIDARRIAIMGHSLGGQTTYLLGYNSCCRDRRVKAAITIEGAEYDVPGGQFAWGGVPLLIVLGDQDPVIPATIGNTLLSRFSTAAYLLTIFGGNHSGGMDSGDPGHSAVMLSIVRFLDAYLKGSPTSLRELQTEPMSTSTRLTQVHTHTR
jgi:dienelactone hydrolase